MRGERFGHAESTAAAALFEKQPAPESAPEPEPEPEPAPAPAPALSGSATASLTALSGNLSGLSVGGVAERIKRPREEKHRMR